MRKLFRKQVAEYSSGEENMKGVENGITWKARKEGEQYFVLLEIVPSPMA